MKIRRRTGVLANGVLLLLLLTQTGFADHRVLTIQEAVEISLANNPSVKIADRKVDASKADMKGVKSRFFPKMTASAQYIRLDTAPYISLSGNPMGAMLPPGTPSKITMGDDDTYEMGVSVTQPLFTGFALSSSYDAMKSLSVAEEHNRSGVKNNLVYKTKEACYTLIKARKLVTVSEEAVTLLDAHVADLEILMEKGLASKNDLLKARVQLSEMKLQAVRARNGENLSERNLCTVLSIPVDTTIELRGNEEGSKQDYNLDSLVNTSIKQRPELHSLEKRIDAAEKNVKIARSERFPQLSAVYNFKYNRPNREYKPEFYDSWNAGVVAQINLFDWGGVSSRVEKARMEKRQAEQGKKQLVDGIILEINQAYLNLKEAEERLDLTNLTVEQAKENYRVTKLKFAEGLVSNTELLDANTSLNRAKIEKTTAQIDYAIAIAAIERVTANGNQER